MVLSRNKSSTYVPRPWSQLSRSCPLASNPVALQAASGAGKEVHPSSLLHQSHGDPPRRFHPVEDRPRSPASPFPWPPAGDYAQEYYTPRGPLPLGLCHPFDPCHYTAPSCPPSSSSSWFPKATPPGPIAPPSGGGGSWTSALPSL